MKKRTKIIIISVFLVLLIGVGWVANSFFGNPLSKMLVKHSVNNHIEKHYSEDDFEIDKIYYNFKTGEYDAKIISPSSVDSHFTVTVPFYKVRSDTYETDVLSGWNTYRRIDDAYGKLVEDVFSAENFPLKSDIQFGTIEVKMADEPDAPDYALERSQLEIDKEYDVKALAEEVGHIIFYAQDEAVTYEKASELLLLLKEELDKADVPFYAVDFNLEQPIEDEQARQENVEGIYTSHFLATDITEDDLADRIKQAHEALMESYQGLK